jgi:hypothetical protein
MGFSVIISGEKLLPGPGVNISAGNIQGVIKKYDE